MPKYMCFFSYTREAGQAMIEKPTDRVAAAKALVESIGGKMECFYWMHGHHDGFFMRTTRTACPRPQWRLRQGARAL
jgi:uncharacterized protein with GYD domain